MKRNMLAALFLAPLMVISWSAVSHAQANNFAFPGASGAIGGGGGGTPTTDETSTGSTTGGTGSNAGSLSGTAGGGNPNLIATTNLGGKSLGGTTVGQSVAAAAGSASSASNGGQGNLVSSSQLGGTPPNVYPAVVSGAPSITAILYGSSITSIPSSSLSYITPTAAPAGATTSVSGATSPGVAAGTTTGH